MAHDYSKLKGKIIEKFSTQGNFARAIGLSEKSLSNKLSSKIDWKQSEIIAAMQLLNINKEEIGQFFFT